MDQNSMQINTEIGLEACSGAHHWGRELVARGYQVKLMARQFVKPYVKSNKSNRNDAAAVCEVMSLPSMRFVALKTTEQQDIQAVHRVRSELIAQRTAKANQIPGLVGEYGLVAPLSIHALRASLPVYPDFARPASPPGSGSAASRVSRADIPAPPQLVVDLSIVLRDRHKIKVPDCLRPVRPECGPAVSLGQNLLQRGLNRARADLVHQPTVSTRCHERRHDPHLGRRNRNAG